jgi:hypothetical protein
MRSTGKMRSAVVPLLQRDAQFVTRARALQDRGDPQLAGVVVLRPDPVDLPSDDHDELGLVVHLVARQLDRDVGSGKRGGELREHHEVLGMVEVRLVGVVAIVEPDREHLAGIRHRGTEPGGIEPVSRTAGDPG